MENKKKPAIRFKGFCDDWEQRKVAEIGNIITGSTPKTSISDNYGGEFLFVSPADIQGNRYVDETITTLTKKGFDQGRKIRERASLFVSIGSTIGKVAQTSQESTTNQQINAVEPYDNFDDDFIFTSLENISGSIKAIATNQAVPIVNKTTFGETEIQVPSELAEQQRIGAYFRNLDHLITLHQRKCNKLQLIKKSMLEKMFPQNSQNIPEVRFKGFTDAWEQRKLPEFVSFFNGLTYTPDDVQETGTLVLRSSNVKNGEIVDADNVYVSDKVATSENVQEGDIIVVVRNGSRALIGKHAQIKASMPNTVIGAFMSGIRSGHSSFINALLDTSAFENEIAKNMGATINQITGYMFSKMEFMIPSEEEQQRIGEYFSNLDHLITLHQRELEKLQIIKKSMLEKMFV